MIGSAVWLITGGGFFARHFARYLLDHAHPDSVRLLIRSEAQLAEVRSTLNDPRVRYLSGDIKDLDRLTLALDGVDLVVHAAALKRIDDCEQAPWEACRTNVQGTQNVATACMANGVQRAIFLSTDKAAAPHTLYGSTKLVAERVWNGGNVYAASSGTRFACTRYGNIAGSTGSVIPTWREQALTGTITLTDPMATRFLMSARQACELVIQAFERMRGGEVFLPKMKATDVSTLADVVAPHAARRVIGLRPAEKLHEELLTEHERPSTRDVGGLYVLHPTYQSWTSAPVIHQGQALTQPYRSDTAERLTVEELTAMVGEA